MNDDAFMIVNVVFRGAWNPCAAVHRELMPGTTKPVKRILEMQNQREGEQGHNGPLSGCEKSAMSAPAA